VKPLPISVCFISGAEAHRIGKALESVAGWTSEIIVVLNENVQDGTEELCTTHGARVFREPWKGHIDQKNSAAAKASQPWILGLDADEVVSPQLRQGIEAALGDPARSQPAAYRFARCTQFCGRWIRHGDWYPDHQTRLWQRSRAVWGGVNPHDKLLVEGKVARLPGDLLHFTAVGMDDQVAKIAPYSNDFLKAALAGNRPTSAFDLVCRPWWRFIRGYILRLGFLDGWQGYYIAWMTAFQTLTRYAKVRMAAQQRRRP
jgi:glycosyltransferase involved in cell wall biosynthesis